MAIRKSIMWFAILLVCLFNTDAIPSKRFRCPKACDCRFFRINWVTDCTNKNLTLIPHKELDNDTYELNMNHNFLSELEPFPSSIRVSTLKLSNNLLKNINSTTFGGFHHLLDVDLSNNLISYIDPSAFIGNKGLITIDLHGNQLDPVSGPFIASRTLRNLNLANCRLTEISPIFFHNIFNVNRLDLSGNSLEKLNLITFNSLRNLRHLILKNCNLTYISSQAFYGLEELTRLELAQNKLTDVDDWALVLRHLIRLDYLDLRRAGVAQLSVDTFTRNIWLRSLDLAENKLSNLNVAITLGRNLIHLDLLDLSNCDLERPLSRNTFSYVTQLRTLMLSGNRLISTDLPATLSPLVKLVKLSLRNCRLSGLKTNTFEQLTSLKELDISRNPLIRNNGSLRFLSILEPLEYLDMSYCNLEEISATIFANMSNLKTLILSGNKLQFLEPGLFQNFNDLQVLELNDCGLSSLYNILFFSDFPYYPDLVELRLSDNPIQIPKEGSIFPFFMFNLNNLDMSNCNLSYLPKDFFILTPNLKYLLLNDNELKGDGENMEFLEHLTNIQELNMNSNNMTSIDPNVFCHNRRLVSLKLIGNPWKCHCFIVDMWNWAASKKGHSDILNSSARLNSHKKDKNTNYLMCDYDLYISPIIKSKNLSTSSKSALNARVTWQKYVRDTVCPPVSFAL